MSEASDRVSCISHKKSSRFFVIYDDFLTVAKVSEHQHKLAAFWRVLETKTNDWINNHADEVDALLKADKPLPEIWVEMSYNDFVNRCLGFYKASSFRIAAVESERLGFSKSRLLTRPTKPTDSESRTEEYKEYCLNIQALQSVMNGGAYPTPVENNSPLLKKRKKKTPVENNSPLVENNKAPLLKTTETPVENNNLKNIEEYTKDTEEEENAHVSDDNAPTHSHSSQEVTPPESENTAQGNEQSSEQAVSYSQSEQKNEAPAEPPNENKRKGSKGRGGSRKPRKPAIPEEMRPRIETFYSFIDTWRQNKMDDPDEGYERTPEGDAAICDLLSRKKPPTQERFKKMLDEMWDEPKNAKTGWHTRSRMGEVPFLCKEYKARCLAVAATDKKTPNTKNTVETAAALASKAGYQNQTWEDDDDLEYLPVSKKQGA